MVTYEIRAASRMLFFTLIQNMDFLVLLKLLKTQKTLFTDEGNIHLEITYLPGGVRSTKYLIIYRNFNKFILYLLTNSRENGETAVGTVLLHPTSTLPCQLDTPKLVIFTVFMTLFYQQGNKRGQCVDLVL